MSDNEQEKPDANGRIKVPQFVIYVVIALVGWSVSAFVGYTAASNTMNARVSVLEIQYQQLHSDIVDIKSDVKELLRRP